LKAPASRARSPRSPASISPTPARLSVSALYLRAWLAARLPQAAFHFVPAPPRRHGNLQALRFHAATQELELRAEDDATLEIVTNTLTTRVLAPARLRSRPAEEELSILGDDLIYEDTLAATVTPVPTAE
jgi:hypothetical protein